MKNRISVIKKEAVMPVRIIDAEDSSITKEEKRKRTKRNVKSGIRGVVKVLITALLVAIVAFFCIHASSSKWDWRHPISSLIQSMADEMIMGIAHILTEATYETGDKLVEGITQGFGPNANLFMYVFNSSADSANDIRDYSYMADAGINTYSNDYTNVLTKTCQIFGASMMIIFFIGGLTWWLVSDKRKNENTPVSLVAGFIFAGILITVGAKSLTPLMQVGDNIWRDYVMTDASAETEGTTVQFKHLLPGDLGPLYSDDGSSPSTDDDDEVEVNILGCGIIVASAISPFALLLPLILLLIAWPLIKGFLQLYAAIIERYIIVCLLFFCFPAIACTAVLKNTRRIFMSYISMFISQVFLLLVNVTFMKMVVQGICIGAFTCSVPNYIFGLAFIKTAQSLERLMLASGLSVTQSGGAFMSNTLGALMMLRTVPRGLSAIGNAKHGIADAARVVGLKTGHAEMGNMAGKAIDGVDGMLRNMKEGGSNAHMMNVMRKNGVYGEGIAVGRREAAGIVNSIIGNPQGSREQQERFNMMNKGSQLSGVASVMGEKDGRYSNMDLMDAKVGKNGSIDFTGAMNGKEVSGHMDADGIHLDNNLPEDGRAFASADTGDVTGKPAFTVDNDMNALNQNGEVVGAVQPNGEIIGEDGSVIGEAYADVTDAEGNIIGSATPDGNVTALDGAAIGSVDDETGYVSGMDGKPYGEVQDDGTVTDMNGKAIGQMDNQGNYFDTDGEKIGTVGEDGTITAEPGTKIGEVDGAGNVIGNNGENIGNVAGLSGQEGEKIGSVGADGKKVGMKGADWHAIGSTSAPTASMELGMNSGTLDAMQRMDDRNGNTSFSGSISSMEKGADGRSRAYGKDGSIVGTYDPKDNSFFIPTSQISADTDTGIRTGHTPAGGFSQNNLRQVEKSMGYIPGSLERNRDEGRNTYTAKISNPETGRTDSIKIKIDDVNSSAAPRERDGARSVKLNSGRSKVMVSDFRSERVHTKGSEGGETGRRENRPKPVKGRGDGKARRK